MTTKSMIRKGFTLVELTLVMAFMSILLLAILYLTLHAGKLYTKGITNKTMNQVGRDVADLMKRDFLAANASVIKVPGEVGSGDLKSGRICTGNVSYVWNTAPLLNSTSPKITAAGNSITFRRVLDSSESLCTMDGMGRYPMNIPATMTSTELLAGTGRDFAIYTMSISPVASDGGSNGLYGVKMVLGTNESGTTKNDTTNGTGFQCLPPTDNAANFDYCTVEELYTILRVGGKD